MLIGDVTIQAARKQHTCWWCGDPIEPGETYRRWLWKDRGDVEAVKVHDDCYAAWKTLEPGDNEVDFAEFCRGCTCERGDCRCGKDDRCRET